MISFKHLLSSAISSLTPAKDQIVVDPKQHMYVDFQEGNEIVRRVIKSPGTAVSSTYTLSSGSWSNKTYTLSVSGLTATQDGVIGISKTATQTQADAARDAFIRISGQAAGSITLTADGDVPTVDIPVDLILFTVE